MTIDPNALLRSLAGGGGTNPAKQSSPAQGMPIGPDFAALLQAARAGDIHSGIKVSTARDANVSLSDEQLARLGTAADLAEANGIGRGLFVIDGRQVLMDVGNRKVLGEVPPGHAGLVDGIDGVVNVPVPTKDQPTVYGAQPIAPGTGLASVGNASLLQALSQRGTQAA